MFVCIFLFDFSCYYVFVAVCFPPRPMQYIFHMLMAQYSLFVLEVPLNTNLQQNSLSIM